MTINLNEEYLKQDKIMKIKGYGKNKVLFSKFCKTKNSELRIWHKGNRLTNAKNDLYQLLLERVNLVTKLIIDGEGDLEITAPGGRKFIVYGLDRNIDLRVTAN